MRSFEMLSLGTRSPSVRRSNVAGQQLHAMKLYKHALFLKFSVPHDSLQVPLLVAIYACQHRDYRFAYLPCPSHEASLQSLKGFSTSQLTSATIFRQLRHDILHIRNLRILRTG